MIFSFTYKAVAWPLNLNRNDILKCKFIAEEQPYLDILALLHLAKGGNHK